MAKRTMPASAWCAVLLLLAALCLGSTSSVLAASAEFKESAKIMDKLETLCRDKCVQRLAPREGDDACTHFCGFIKHIRVAHEDDVYALFLENKRNVSPLAWAMNDIVQEKLQAKLDDEDDHMLGELFFEKARGWSAYIRQRDEL